MSETGAIPAPGRGSGATERSAVEHLVHFYESDELLAPFVANFLSDGIRAGDALLVIATQHHSQALQLQLEAQGIDTASLCTTGQLTLLDANETLAMFMRNGQPDRDLFERSVGAILGKRTADVMGRARLRAYGEMVDILWNRGEHDAAIRLEELWNDLQQRHPFALLCAYAIGNFYKEPADLQRVCGTHTHLVGTGYTTSLPDPSVRRSAEEELGERQQHLQIVTDALPTLVAFVDNSQRYRFVNAAYERWFGHAKSKVIGRHLAEALGTDAYEAIRPHVESALAGETVEYEAEIPYRDGGTRFIGATYIPQHSKDGSIAGFVALVADISERKGFEQYRAASASRAEQLYRFAQAVVSADTIEKVFEAALSSIEAAVETKRAAILTFDNDGVMRFRAWHGLSDAYRNAVEGHSPWTKGTLAPEPILVPDPASDPAMASYLPLFEREGIGALAFIPLVTRGRLIGKCMVYFAQPHSFAPQEVATAKAIANHLASVVTRFAVVAKLEETIRYNEIFAGALAHDLRNPLNAIMTAGQLLLMQREGSKSDHDAKPLSTILASGQRMTTMIDQLLDFTRARSGGGIDVHPTETNLADLCAQAIGELELAHPEWKIHCNIVGDQGGTWDADRLLQVISNLVANAGQHGTPEAAIMVKLDGTHADQVTLEVHNQGAVPDSLLPQLFDPFRSTGHPRDQSRGLGLGLFIVREVVRAHGGTVEVASSEPSGTTFTVKLPRIG